MVKDGRAHLASLRDDRTVYIAGRRVADVTADPAFRNAVATAAELYDFQARPENIQSMTFRSPTSGDDVNQGWLLPRNHRELTVRRAALTRWAELSCGMLG